ncbi:hypothetical protein [Planctomyces sp. SH-PL14]|uniref:hypothetical protein n=1 Tax=Planctomyces sp. SH-PL14 TaxID=1632864 RepID=UPI00078D1C67|nr:hypothetical protein [Planctomyces sp. SH-PL14]AMV20452.1 hypothetical protein VT03_21315 [Planctomyces sp. SH-PL14]
MNKLPSFQFYPGDWKKDPGVQALNYHDRGVWFEILLLMHESSKRGVLLLNGKPMPNEALAAALGLDNQNLESTLTKLEAYGVASRDEETGALVCRRMIRDEQLRQIRKTAGSKGGNPSLVNQNPTTQVNQNPTPSSSLSSSITHTQGGGGCGDLIQRAEGFGVEGAFRIVPDAVAASSLEHVSQVLEVFGARFKKAGWTHWTLIARLKRVARDLEPTKGWADQEQPPAESSDLEVLFGATLDSIPPAEFRPLAERVLEREPAALAMLKNFANPRASPAVRNPMLAYLRDQASRGNGEVNRG